MQPKKNIWNNENLIDILEKDGVVVMPTDTIYGMVGRAQNESTVNRIYTIRKRNPEKPCIILIGDIRELENFSVTLSLEQKRVLEEYWPASAEASAGKTRPVSIVLDCLDDSFAYLHRGTKTLAFRLPTIQELRDLLLTVGPLIAPSANLETFPPNDNIRDAKKYFGDSVDLYVDGGTIVGKASKVIRLYKDGSVSVLRP
jgi:L-threonylcarbamoyladenylate synthase